MTKSSIKELESEVQKLLSQDQAPQVEAKIKELEAEIAEKRKIGQRLADAKKSKEGKRPPDSKEEQKKMSQFHKYEEWKHERKPINENGRMVTRLVRKEKPERIVMLLDEHAEILNQQKENTLTEYIKIQ